MSSTTFEPCADEPKAVEQATAGNGGLTGAEIVVGLKERGYRLDDDPHVLLVSLRDAFKRNRSRFSRGEDGRWAASYQ